MGGHPTCNLNPPSPASPLIQFAGNTSQLNPFPQPVLYPVCIEHIDPFTREVVLQEVEGHGHFVTEGMGDTKSSTQAAAPQGPLARGLYEESLRVWGENEYLGVIGVPTEVSPFSALLTSALAGPLQLGLCKIDGDSLEAATSVRQGTSSPPQLECRTCSCEKLGGILWSSWNGSPSHLQKIISDLNGSTPTPHIRHGTCTCDCSKCAKVKEMACPCCFSRLKKGHPSSSSLSAAASGSLEAPPPPPPPTQQQLLEALSPPPPPPSLPLPLQLSKDKAPPCSHGWAVFVAQPAPARARVVSTALVGQERGTGQLWSSWVRWVLHSTGAPGKWLTPLWTLQRS